jgi:hypothetical protein
MPHQTRRVEDAMARHGRFGIQHALVVVVVCAASGLAARVGSPQTPAAGTAATAAAQASPELIGALSKEMSATPEQAAGAAGALFGVAKSRLTANELSQVSKAVPGMNALLDAAPAPSPSGTVGGLSQLAGSAAGLATAASAFAKLGLSPDMAAKAVPVLTAFVTKSGGADAGAVLARALK